MWATRSHAISRSPQIIQQQLCRLARAPGATIVLVQPRLSQFASDLGSTRIPLLGWRSFSTPPTGPPTTPATAAAASSPSPSPSSPATPPPPPPPFTDNTRRTEDDQHRQSPHKKTNRRLALRRFLTTLAIFPVVYFVFENVGSLSGVRGTSMSPTLNPQAIVGHSREGGNDVVFVWRLGAATYDYQRGQVVVLTSPTNPKIKTVKRLIALEGDWVHDRARPELIVAIPEGRCWIEGDNADTSVDDSRTHGPVPLALLCGHVTHVVWPPSRMGAVQTTLEPAGGTKRIRPPKGRLVPLTTQ